MITAKASPFSPPTTKGKERGVLGHGCPEERGWINTHTQGGLTCFGEVRGLAEAASPSELEGTCFLVPGKKKAVCKGSRLACERARR